MAVNLTLLAKMWLDLVRAGRKQEADVPAYLQEEYTRLKEEA
jgi:hypothetical protein